MDHAGALLQDGFERVRQVVSAVLDAADDGDLVRRPSGDGPPPNTVAWLVWHLTRVQDDHVAKAFEREQVWETGGWADRLGLPFGLGDLGFGHAPDDVAAVVASGADLRAYHEAVHRRTRECLSGMSAADLDRVVDRSWDPPVTLGVRLMSVLSDDLQHAGQAAYVLGLLGEDLGPTGAG